MKRYLALLPLTLVLLLSGCSDDQPTPEQLAAAKKEAIKQALDSWAMDISHSKPQEFRSALRTVIHAEQRLISAERAAEAESAHSLYNLAASCLFYLEETRRTPATLPLLQEIRSRLLQPADSRASHNNALGMLQNNSMTLRSGEAAQQVCQQLKRSALS